MTEVEIDVTAVRESTSNKYDIEENFLFGCYMAEIIRQLTDDQLMILWYRLSGYQPGEVYRLMELKHGAYSLRQKGIRQIIKNTFNGGRHER